MKNIHLPLPERLRRAMHDQIAAYATEMAGTDFDLDPDLEAAGIEHLVAHTRTAPMPPEPRGA